MKPDRDLVAATAAPTIAAASAIPAPAAIARGAAAAVGRTARTVARKPASPREAVIRRVRIAVAATALAPCPGARARAAVLQMGHQGIADQAGGPDGDEG